MTTFIKLTNGTNINRESIRSFEKEEHFSADMYAQMFAEAGQEPYDFDNPKPGPSGIPAIKLYTEGERMALLEFATQEERDAEFDRIEAFVHNKPQRVLSNLTLNPSTVQAIHADWDGSTLVITINTGASEPIIVRVDESNKEDIKGATKLFTDFGLTMPLTLMQKVKRLREEDGL